MEKSADTTTSTKNIKTCDCLSGKCNLLRAEYFLNNEATYEFAKPMLQSWIEKYSKICMFKRSENAENKELP